ncbi:hypothetical protein N7519_006701 [Penicillium mononematosum]|uniref:uncharacterized protein n=1 Tax=Penicillium mononematosum TaxID=268346 RepID=UPI0025476A20|nr:uncharacterized protein N7519_006701 [Penicillium mononematosum]KAJ6185400.1 hypothetical protein N7519_006701 [Penicillium mononematosum]
MASIATSVAIAAVLQALARAVLEYLGEPVVETYPSPKPPLANVEPNLQPKPASTDYRPVRPTRSRTAPQPVANLSSPLNSRKMHAPK